MHSAASTRILSDFLPAARADWQDLAHGFVRGRMNFALPEIAGSVAFVAGMVFPRPAAGHYRYPSLNGRPDVPKVRPSALFRTADQAIVNRPICAGRNLSLEHFSNLRVRMGTRINRGVTERCAEQKLSPSHLPVSRASRPVVTPSANRHSWVARPASVPRQSLAATSAPARLSVAPQTSPIVRRTPAPAAASADLTYSTRRARPSGPNQMKPRCSRSAAGFLHVKSPWENRGQGPGRD